MKINETAVQVAIDGKPYTIDLRNLRRGQAQTLMLLAKRMVELDKRSAVTDSERSGASELEQDRVLDDAFEIIASGLPHAVTRRLSRAHRTTLVRTFIPRIVRAVGAR